MTKTLLTQRDDVFVVRNFLSPSECERYIALSEAAGYGDAPISTFAGPVMNLKMRNNNRVMIDDHASADELWAKLEPHVPSPRGRWQACGLNERFRFYRYDAGQQFDWHFDGRFERSPLEVSELTFMVYLNDGCEGGHTEFNFDLTNVNDPKGITAVVPEQGMALVFVHRVLHRGAPVTHGRKYVLRSDVMYRSEPDES